MNGNLDGKRSAIGLAEQRTDMASDRTRWAADRTFVAWLRTSISMIGFGTAIGKAGDALESQGFFVDTYHGPQIFGLTFISLAVLGLIGALVQNIRIERRMASKGYGRVEPTPISQAMGFLVLLFGIAAAIYILV